jgi:endonuclease-3
MSKLYQILSKYYREKSPWVEVEEVLKAEGEPKERKDFYDPFKNLIIGILSQNTSDRNSTRAYINLKRKFKIEPEELAKAKESEISRAIKVGGLYKIKAKRIKELAKVVMEKFKGNLKEITKLSPKEARKILISLPGIGEKTADVFLAYCMKEPTIPIDTNIARVAKRIGLAKKDAGYKEIQKTLKSVFSKKERIRGHELLIRLGRDFCKAKNPLCKNCPISIICKKQI